MRSWPWTVVVTVMLVVGIAGAAHAASPTAVVSQEAHLTSSPPSGAGIATIDLGADPPVGSTPVGAPNPFEVVITPDARTAYVGSAEGCASSTANQVIPVDLTGTPAAARPPIALGATGAFGLGISPDGKTIYAAGCGKVVPIDVSVSPPAPGPPITVGLDAFEVVVSADGRTLWTVDHSADTVSVVDLSAAPPAAVKTITVGRQPLGMALSPDGSKLYVANGRDCTISVIDTATETAGATPIALPAAACSATPQGFFGDPGRLAMSPDGATLYAASVDAQAVTPVDTATRAPGTPISFSGVTTPTGLPFRPGALAFTPDGARLLVADAGGGPGSQFGNTVQIVSTPANTLSGPPVQLHSALGVGNDAAVTPDQAPVASFTVASAPPGAATTLNASASTVAFGAIRRYAWDFGDGTPAVTTDGPQVAHVYASAGTYSARVTETSAAGTSLPSSTRSTGRTLVRRGDDSARTTRTVVVTAGPRPVVTLGVASLDFGAAAIGVTTPPKPATITNSGDAPLHVAGVRASGDFAVGATTCQTVAPGASCIVDVTFTPTAGGARAGALALTDDASGSPHTVALAGIGTTTGTITGTVAGEDRAPLAGAAVTSCTITFSACAGARADAAGRYRFAGLAPGGYVLTIEPPSGSALSTGSRLATVKVGQTDDATTTLGRDAPLPKSISITSPKGTAAGGHPTLFWDDPFTIGLPRLKALGRGAPGTAVSTTIFVALRTAGTGQTVLGSALHYLVAYGKDGAPANAIVLDDPLPGVLDDGFSFTIGDVAAPPNRPVRVDPAALAAATTVTASSTGLRRAAHGNLRLSISPVRVTRAANAPAPVAAGVADACATIKENTKFREDLLESEIQRLAEFERTGEDPEYNPDDDPSSDDFDDPDADDTDGDQRSHEDIQEDILRSIALDRERLEEARAAEDQVCHPTAPPCDSIFDVEFDAGPCPPDADVPVDPSGFVRTTRGVPLEGARVVLERADTAAGPFTPPPDGDAVMSADNRRNPDGTDIDGHFGWDVFPGYYRVRATRPGCRGEALTKALPVPPPVTDLLLRLRCPGLRRAPTRTTVTGVRHGVVRVRVRAKRRVVGVVRVAVGGRVRAMGFVGAHGRARILVSGRVPRGRVTARYAGNARFAPSHGR